MHWRKYRRASSLPAVPFAVFDRGKFHEPGEHTRKIILVLYPEFGCYFLYRHLREQQVLAGLLYFERIEIFHGSITLAFLEYGGKMRDGQSREIGKGLEVRHGVQLSLHQLDGAGDDIVYGLARGPAELLFIQQRRQEMVKDHVHIAQVVLAIALFQVGVNVFE